MPSAKEDELHQVRMSVALIAQKQEVLTDSMGKLTESVDALVKQMILQVERDRQQAANQKECSTIKDTHHTTTRNVAVLESKVSRLEKIVYGLVTLALAAMGTEIVHLISK